MKQVILLSFALITAGHLQAQNVGIGTAEPLNKLHVIGNLLINTPSTATSSTPTPAQTRIMGIHSGLFAPSDSTGRIYDPGGPAGNYPMSSSHSVFIDPANCIGIELIAESMQLGAGDSLIIKETLSSPVYLAAVGNGYTTTGKWVFNTSTLYILFKSNADVSVGSGFSLSFRRLYDNSNILPDVAGYAGNSFLFDTKTGSFRSGLVKNQTKGEWSAAWGLLTTASGDGSTAMGSNTIASGGNSTTMGSNTVASGSNSTAMGSSTAASGINSIAMGSNTMASGHYSIAIGRETESRGYAGTAIGLFNNPVLAAAQVSVSDFTPLFIVGNGNNDADRSNAMVVLKNGNTGIGTDAPGANLHILHPAGGGLILENSNDNNQWRIYSASGDNNLTFYNNANTEIADIDDATGTFSALSDGRFKKDVRNISAVLPLLMQLQPKQYHFNWQQTGEEMQLGFIAQEAYQLFPQLVSYDKEKDLYKMNYAGFSTVAIKAIQEQQTIITAQEKKIDALQARLEKLEAAILKN